MRKGQRHKEGERPTGETEAEVTETQRWRQKTEMKQTERWGRRHDHTETQRQRGGEKQRKDETKAEWREGKTETRMRRRRVQQTEGGKAGEGTRCR